MTKQQHHLAAIAKILRELARIDWSPPPPVVKS
jgi:hypothetical protein